MFSVVKKPFTSGAAGTTLWIKASQNLWGEGIAWNNLRSALTFGPGFALSAAATSWSALSACW